MKKQVKKIVKPVFEVAEDLAKEAKKQITAKAPAPEETLGAAGPGVSQQQKQQAQQQCYR